MPSICLDLNASSLILLDTPYILLILISLEIVLLEFWTFGRFEYLLLSGNYLEFGLNFKVNSKNYVASSMRYLE